jgi:hypothetical protein
LIPLALRYNIPHWLRAPSYRYKMGVHNKFLQCITKIVMRRDVFHTHGGES